MELFYHFQLMFNCSFSKKIIQVKFHPEYAQIISFTFQNKTFANFAKVI